MSNEKQYRLMANQSYDTIPQEIGLQLELNPDVLELRFVRVNGTRLMYDSYVLEGSNIPVLDGFDFINCVGRRNLADVLKSEIMFREEQLPQEIRVIRPEYKGSLWGIFLK